MSEKNVLLLNYDNQFDAAVDGDPLDLSSGIPSSRSYSSHLRGCVGDLFACYAQVEFAFYSEASSTDEFEITGGLDNNRIERETGSFIADGFQPGDTIDYFQDKAAAITATGRTVLSVGTTFLIFDGAAVVDSSSNTTAKIWLTDEFFNFELNANLVRLDNAETNQSIIDGIPVKWTVDIDDGAGNQSTTYVDADLEAQFPTSIGDDDSVSLKYDGVRDTYYQQFTVRHIFRLRPWYLDGELTAIQNNQPPSYWTDSRIVNYLNVTPVVNSLPNNYRALNATEGLTSGDAYGSDTYWFGQKFNVTLFDVTDITYTDKTTSVEVDGLQIDKVTEVQINVTGAVIDLDSNLNLWQVLISKLPKSTEYTFKDTNFDTNFVFDAAYTQRNATAVDFDYIKNLEVVAGATPAEEVVITFEVDFSSAQQALLSNDEYYMIAVGSSFYDKTQLKSNYLSDVALYVKDNDVPGLFQVDSFEFVPHQESVGTGVTDIKRPIQAKFLSVLDFSIDLSLNAFIKTITERLVAYDSVNDTFFTIEENVFDVQNVVVSSGTQQINIDQTKGYRLDDGSIFNLKKITTGSKVGDLQGYQMQIAHSFNWMDYLSLPNADGVFYDNSLPFDGLNQKISQYSGVSNYEILVFWDFLINNGDRDTIYRVRSTDLKTYDFDTSGVLDPFSDQEIQVFREDGTTEITGSMLSGETMYIKATFTPTTPISTSIGYYGIWRLEHYQNGGLESIWERSSVNDSIDFNPILPLAGDSYPKVTNNGSTITLEGRIDPTRFIEIAEGDQVFLTAEIGRTSVVVDAKITEAGEYKITESSEFKVTE